jgi:hypothetical protein
MKTSRFAVLLALTAGPAALLTSSCSKTDSASAAADQAAAAAKESATDVKVAVSDSWSSINDFTYDRRAEFSASMDRMAGKLDKRADELKAKVAAMPDDTTQARQSAAKEYDEARADLKTKLSDLDSATADTWADAKEKVAKAWDRVQAACDKMTSSATT